MERRTQNPPLFRQAISHSLQAEHALEGEDGDGESSATKDLTFLVARALAAATIACSPHITITTGGTNLAIPF
jgi:hypothetical protein